MVICFYDIKGCLQGTHERINNNTNLPYNNAKPAGCVKATEKVRHNVDHGCYLDYNDV